jgi:hypothetical protein
MKKNPETLKTLTKLFNAFVTVISKQKTKKSPQDNYFPLLQNTIFLGNLMACCIATPQNEVYIQYL